MHPFGLYLAATDIERKNRAAQGQDRARFASVDALPVIEPAAVSRLARFAAMLRRRSGKVAHLRGV